MGAGVRKSFDYFNVTCGKLEQSVKNPETGKWDSKPYNNYTGKLRWIEIVDDIYNKKPIKKVKLVMLDSDNPSQEALITFTLKGWYTIGFFQRIAKIDLENNFTLGVNGSKEVEKISFCWMNQNGMAIEKDENFPIPTVIDAETKDWRDTIAEIENLVKNLKSVLSKMYGGEFKFSVKHAEDDHPGVPMPTESPRNSRPVETGREEPPPPISEDGEVLPF